MTRSLLIHGDAASIRESLIVRLGCHGSVLIERKQGETSSVVSDSDEVFVRTERDVGWGTAQHLLRVEEIKLAVGVQCHRRHVSDTRRTVECVDQRLTVVFLVGRFLEIGGVSSSCRKAERCDRPLREGSIGGV
ncbi:hypothetical protein F442_18756 [Phytophthora nicotianae P10297]|uniref:Uncharacterized protein n=1 Tax=Phytophthora nicotianae P10297 TaxID=1317064 RepID=W2YBX4_PHYNI|nr:hypothetical protein F442_18756 [Phytophthora nicotianae P10297]